MNRYPVGSMLHLPVHLLRGVSPNRLILHALAFALIILCPMAMGFCGCTMFTIAAVALVLAMALGVGNSAFGALTTEREKKTLDCLRLTQLTPHEVLLGKLAPEAGVLVAFLLAMGPTVLLAGLWAGVAPTVMLGVLVYAVLTGVLAAVMGICVSSQCSTTSQAVVAGWFAKLTWLLAFPILDVVMGAVLVQAVAPPIFSSLDPLAALGVLLVPEAAEGTRTALPWLFPLASVLATVAMWIVAARRFATGMGGRSGLAGEHVHAAYRNGFVPCWLARLFPMLHANPAFLREVTAQVRAGAGRWPSYLIFVVLFLAPTFYARSWTLKEVSSSHADYSVRPGVTVEKGGDAVVKELDQARGCESRPVVPGLPVSRPGVRLRSTASYETEAVLVGHTTRACLRTYLLQAWSVPLPMADVRFYQRVTQSPPPCTYDRPSPPAVSRCVPVATVSRETAAAFRVQTPDTAARAVPVSPRRESADKEVTLSSLRMGLVRSIALLLLYLCIRYSAFLATAVTGEKSRRTWDDLALSGIRVQDVLGGKLLGAIILPTMQMTAVFPLLLLFVLSDNVTGAEVLGLYVYALALSVAAATLGLWASSCSRASHGAHVRALSVVLVGFFVPVLLMRLPDLSMLLAMGGLCGLLFCLVTRRTGIAPWLTLILALALAPHVLSPLTAAVSFMPSLTAGKSFLSLLGVAPASAGQAVLNLVCGVVMLLSLARIFWESAVSRLVDPRQAGAVGASAESALVS